MKVESGRFSRSLTVDVRETIQPDVWICQSKESSQPRKVTKFDDGRYECDCPDFSRPGIEVCKHIAAVARHLGEVVESVEKNNGKG